MDFERSIKDLSDEKPLSYEDACVWLGVLTHNWTDAPTRDNMQYKIMRQTLRHLDQHPGDTAEKTFMKPDMIETLVFDRDAQKMVPKSIPNFKTIFADEHKFMGYAFMALDMEYERLRKPDVPEAVFHKKNQSTAVLLRTQASEVRSDLKKAAMGNRIEPPPAPLGKVDECLAFFKSEWALLTGKPQDPLATEKELYVRAFKAVVDDKSPLIELRRFSSEANELYTDLQTAKVFSSQPK